MTDRSDLARHLQDVVESRDEESRGGPAAPNGAATSRKRAIRFLVVGWAIIAWIWLARPGFLFDVDEASAGAADREASLRFGMVLQRDAIEGYAEANGGRLPDDLSDVGEPDEDIQMQRVGRGYVLTAKTGELTLRLTDAMDADSFLGNSLRVLQAKP